MKYQIVPILAAAMLLTGNAAADVRAAAAVPENQPQETADTLIGIGSVSKIFVTAAVMQLADQGKIDLDAPVTDYLPEFRLADSRYQKITVRMLMNHRSGLMGSYYHGDILLDDRSTALHDSFLQKISGERLRAEPGAYGAYCNDGFELLELIAEHVSGEDFTDYIEKHICKPLGLQQTGTPLNAFQTAEQVPVYHRKAEMAPDYCMTIGSGGILSTAKELCEFGSAFFSGNTALLSETAKDAMRTRSTGDPYEDGFGLGWDSVGTADYDAAGVQVVSKGGDLVYQHAELLVAPDEEISVAVLSSGGSSSSNALLAEALLDIALEEKGIPVQHSKPQKQTLRGSVPEKYLKYEGMYADSRGIWQLTFPQKQYAKLAPLSDPDEDDMNFCPTVSGAFVRMSGDIEAGHAVQAPEQTMMRFREKNGQVYLTSESFSGDENTGYLHYAETYQMQQIRQNPVSTDVQNVWDARGRQHWYLVNADRSDSSYADLAVYRLNVAASGGYVNQLRILDADHAESVLHIPSSASRDQTDIRIRQENGHEVLSLTAAGSDYIPADAIPLLPADCSAVQLTTGAASWYNVGEQTNRVLTLDIPPRAAVYVFDARDRMTYASYMKDYGKTVPLPSGGRIVFIGETGAAVGIKQE